MVRRGETFPEYKPRLDEKFKIFVAVFAPDSPLAPGDTVHLVDFETGLEMPYVVEAGYYSDFCEWFFSLSGMVRAVLLLDDLPPLIMYPEPNVIVHDYEKIVFGDTAWLDPDAEESHTWDFTVTNVDDVDVVGTVQIAIRVRLP